MDRISKGRALFVLAVVAFSMYVSQRFVDGTPPADFTVFWEAARATVIYQPADRPFVNPPSGLLLFKPLALLPFYPAYWAWSAVSVALLLFACRRTMGFLALASGSAIQGLILGNVAVLLGSATILAFTVPAFWGGVLLGIAASVKPQMLLLAPLAMLVRRDLQMMKGAALGLFGMIAASIIAFGPSLWLEWIQRGIPNLTAAIPPGHQVYMLVTPAGRAYALGLPQLHFVIGGAAVGCAAIILAARRVEREMLGGLVIAASLMASPYAHLHDMIGLIPACVGLMLSGPLLGAMIGAVLFIGFKAHMPVALTLFVMWYGVRFRGRAQERSVEDDDHRPHGSQVDPVKLRVSPGSD